MNYNNLTHKVFTHSMVFASLVIPAVVLAHGGVDDGHVEAVPAAAPAVGASALLLPMTPRWFALLAVSSVITALLSYGVYRYLQVPEVKKPEDPTTPAA
jgi:membrane protein implicated in regulation of membrane protease activity